MSVEVRYRGDVAIISPTGDLVNFGEVTLELTRRIRDLAAAGNQKLVVDLGDARVCGVQPLGFLIAARDYYRKRGVDVRLCRISGHARDILQGKMLAPVLRIYATEDEAVASFEETSTPGTPG